MNIVNPYLLSLLGLCLVFLYLLIKRGNRQRKRFAQYAQEHLWENYYASVSIFWIGFRLFLVILAMGFVVLAISRPQWDYETKNLDSSGMDIVFAIDVSKSMDATDMAPSRLLRAIMQITAFVQQLKTDRVGIMAFAGVATLECPLTDDYEAVKMVLGSLNSETVPNPGTDIGEALSLAEKAFSAASKANSLILISDGEDLEDNAHKQARTLKGKGIRVYTMGVGSPEGYLIRNPVTSEEVLSKLDEKNLQEIARITGGEYYRVTPGGDEIQLILQRIYQTEESRSRNKRLSMLKEQYYLFALAALVLLLLEAFIDPRRRKSGLMAAEKANEH